MKIGIIGGGSIGLLFAYYLSRKHPVCLYVRTNEQKKLIRDKGLIVVRGDEEHKEELEVKLVSEWRGLEDSVFIAVKQYQLPSVIEILQKYGRADHFAVFLQNGMGHIKWLDRLHGDIYLATVEHGAMRTNGNQVCHTGLERRRLHPMGNRNQAFLIGLLPNTKTSFRLLWKKLRKYAFEKACRQCSH